VGLTMLGFPNPAILAAGAAASKTYADWQAHIAAISDSIPQDSWFDPSPGMKRVVLAAGTGAMYGSPWKSFFLASFPSIAAPRRIIQHGMPSEATFNAQVSGGREVLLRLSYYGHEQVYTRLNRNGFISSGDDLETLYQAYFCDLVGWWDQATQSALMMNPQAGTGPVPYTATGW